MPKNTRLTRLVHNTIDMWMDSMPGAVGENVTMLQTEPPEGVEFETVMDGDTRYAKVGNSWLKITVMEAEV